MPTDEPARGEAPHADATADPGRGPNVAQGTQAMAIAQVLTQATRFLTNIVLARLLAPRDFGLVAIALVVGMFLDHLKDVGTGSALIQRSVISHAIINAVFWLNVAIGVVLATTVYATAGPLADGLGNADAAPILRAFAGVTFVTSLGQVHHALLRRDLQFRRVAFITTSTALVTAVVSIGLALFGLQVWALVIGNVAASVGSTILCWICDRWRPTLRIDLTQLRSIYHYSAHLFLVDLLGFFFVQTDKILVSRFLGATALGVYALAQRVLMYPLTAVSGVVGEVVFPVLAKHQDNDAAIRAAFTRASSAVALAAFPLMLGVAVVAQPFVDVVFGPKWSDLVPLVWILAPVGALQTVTFGAGGLLMAKGRTDLLFRWTVVSSLIIITSYFIGLRWGLVGLCVAYAVAITLLTPFNLLIGFRLIGMRLRTYALALLPMLVSSLVMAAAVFIVGQSLAPVAGEAVRLVVGVVVGIAAYAAMLMVLRPPAVQDVWQVVRARRAPR